MAIACFSRREGIRSEYKERKTLSRSLDSGPFYHGTKAELKLRDLLKPGYRSNFGEQKKANYVYLTATLDAAIWGAELAVGDEPGRIYRVEPTGTIEDDTNLTDKKFPGNPTRSYRTRQPLRVVGEVLDWKGHSPEELQTMRDHLEELNYCLSGLMGSASLSPLYRLFRFLPLSSLLNLILSEFTRY